MRRFKLTKQVVSLMKHFTYLAQVHKMVWSINKEDCDKSAINLE